MPPTMKSFRLILFFLLTLLAGCGDNPYEKKEGQWRYDGRAIPVEQGSNFKPATGPFAKDARFGYYRGVPIEGSDGETMQILDDHYARDKARAYFCDTYREGQEYYTKKHNTVVIMQGVALESFKPLTRRYARDAMRLYFEGKHVPVKDLESFEILDQSYQRDRVSGYYKRKPIPGSDGSSFEVIGGGYSRDKSSIYFSHYRTQEDALRDKTIRVASASPTTFSIKGGGYGVDAKQVYFNGIALTKDVASFQMLDLLYAKTAAAVYYDGKPIAGVDAATFTVLERRDADADAKDVRRYYFRGEPVANGFSANK